MFDDFYVGKADSVGKSVHSSLYLDNDTVVDNFWSDVVFFHDVIWNVPDCYPHVFKIKHGCNEIEVGNVKDD